MEVFKTVSHYLWFSVVLSNVQNVPIIMSEIVVILNLRYCIRSDKEENEYFVSQGEKIGTAHAHTP